MKAGKYTINELFVNRYLEEIIIPEIQRDYVWGKDQVDGLLDSILHDFKKFDTTELPNLIENDEELQKSFIEFYKKRKFTSNIGFIYAYNDDECPGRYFLIDGQQRITTIYLILLALAKHDPSLNLKFSKTYLLEGRIKLDYKVRQASQDFLENFVPFALRNHGSVEDQTWFYENYKHDVTINSLRKNFVTIQEYLSRNSIDEGKFYEYLEDYTEFWYFDTNVSEQGEELYIYMNARGEQMQASENIKADLLGKIHGPNKELEKDKYGKLWEEWQDFFWINKPKYSENADKGFNEFLSCISGLQNYLSGNKDNFIYDIADSDAQGIRVSEIVKNLSLDIIKKYVDVLRYFNDNKASLSQFYEYHGWTDKCYSDVLEIINTRKTNWYANYQDANKGTERNRMVFVWSILYYLAEADRKDVVSLFRTIRIFYLRYNNYIRSVTSIKSEIDDRLAGNLLFKNDETTEEDLKTKFLERFKAVEKLAVEEVIWEIEDHPYNLNGRDVGGTNISHLSKLTDNINLKDLILLKDRFYEVFSAKNEATQTLQSILLYYGKFWYRISPYYYFNFKFNEWRRIIRDRAEDNDQDFRSTFEDFFAEFCKTELTLVAFLEEKRKKIQPLTAKIDLREMLLWYNQHLDDSMWDQGNYIAYAGDAYCGLPDYQGSDMAFKNNRILYNTKGDLKGGYPQELFLLLPEEVKNGIITEEVVKPNA